MCASHFHLDHCGALPYLTEVVGYDGPVLMTFPTRAICPILLEDYRKIMVDRKGESQFFTSQHIKACMKKVTAVHLLQTVSLGDIHITVLFSFSFSFGFVSYLENEKGHGSTWVL